MRALAARLCCKCILITLLLSKGLDEVLFYIYKYTNMYFLIMFLPRYKNNDNFCASMENIRQLWKK